VELSGLYGRTDSNCVLTFHLSSAGGKERRDIHAISSRICRDTLFQGGVKAQDLGRVEIIDTIRLAPLVLDAGLSVWLLEKGVVDQQARRSSHDTENRVR